MDDCDASGTTTLSLPLGWHRHWRHQGLEVYDNLNELYTLHTYPLESICSCDEIGIQAGRTSRGIIIARRGARRVHTIVPEQREWLSVLVCINVAGLAIPSFYVLKKKSFRQNYIERCKPGVTMSM
jgi:hypothetical protein